VADAHSHCTMCNISLSLCRASPAGKDCQPPSSCSAPWQAFASQKQHYGAPTPAVKPCCRIPDSAAPRRQHHQVQLPLRHVALSQPGLGELSRCAGQRATAGLPGPSRQACGQALWLLPPSGTALLALAWLCAGRKCHNHTTPVKPNDAALSVKRVLNMVLNVCMKPAMCHSLFCVSQV